MTCHDMEIHTTLATLSHLTLDDEVGMFETLYDGHLMLQGQFRVLLDHVGEGLQAYNITSLTELLHSIR